MGVRMLLVCDQQRGKKGIYRKEGQHLQAGLVGSKGGEAAVSLLLNLVVAAWRMPEGRSAWESKLLQLLLREASCHEVLMVFADVNWIMFQTQMRLCSITDEHASLTHLTSCAALDGEQQMLRGAHWRTQGRQPSGSWSGPTATGSAPTRPTRQRRHVAANTSLSCWQNNWHGAGLTPLLRPTVRRSYAAARKKTEAAWVSFGQSRVQKRQWESCKEASVFNDWVRVAKHASSAHPLRLVGCRVEALAGGKQVESAGARRVSVVGRKRRVCAVRVDVVCRQEAHLIFQKILGSHGILQTSNHHRPVVTVLHIQLPAGVTRTGMSITEITEMTIRCLRGSQGMVAW